MSRIASTNMDKRCGVRGQRRPIRHFISMCVAGMSLIFAASIAPGSAVDHTPVGFVLPAKYGLCSSSQGGTTGALSRTNLAVCEQRRGRILRLDLQMAKGKATTPGKKKTPPKKTPPKKTPPASYPSALQKLLEQGGEISHDKGGRSSGVIAQYPRALEQLLGGVEEPKKHARKPPPPQQYPAALANALGAKGIATTHAEGKSAPKGKKPSALQQLLDAAEEQERMGSAAPAKPSPKARASPKAPPKKAAKQGAPTKAPRKAAAATKPVVAKTKAVSKAKQPTKAPKPATLQQLLEGPTGAAPAVRKSRTAKYPAALQKLLGAAAAVVQAGAASRGGVAPMPPALRAYLEGGVTAAKPVQPPSAAMPPALVQLLKGSSGAPGAVSGKVMKASMPAALVRLLEQGGDASGTKKGRAAGPMKAATPAVLRKYVEQGGAAGGAAAGAPAAAPRAAAMPRALKANVKARGAAAKASTPTVAQMPSVLKSYLAAGSAVDQPRPAQYPDALNRLLEKDDDDLGSVSVTEAKMPAALRSYLEQHSEARERMDEVVARYPAALNRLLETLSDEVGGLDEASMAAMPAALLQLLGGSSGAAGAQGVGTAQYPNALSRLLEKMDDEVSVSALEAKMPEALVSYLEQDSEARERMDEVVARYPAALNRLLETLSDEVGGLDEASMAAMPAALLRYMEAEEGVGTEGVGTAQYPDALNRLLEKMDDEVSVSALEAKMPAALVSYLEQDSEARERMDEVVARYPAALYRLLETLSDEVGGLDEASMAAMPAALLRYMEAEEGVGTEGVGTAQYPDALNRLLEKMDDEVSVSALEAKMPAALVSYLEQDSEARERMDEVVARYPAALYRLLEKLEDEVGGLDEASMAAMPAALLRYMEAEEGVGTEGVGTAQYPDALNRLLEKMDDEVSVSALEAKMPAALVSYLEQESEARERMDEVVARYPAALYRLLEKLEDEVGGLDEASMAAMPAALLRYMEAEQDAESVGVGTAQYPDALNRLLEKVDFESLGPVLLSDPEAMMPAALRSYLAKDSEARERMDDVIATYPAALNRLLETLSDEVGGLDEASMAAMPAALLQLLGGSSGAAGAQGVGTAQYPDPLNRLLEKMDDEVSVSALEAKMPEALVSYLEQDSEARERMDEVVARYPAALYRLLEKLEDEVGGLDEASMAAMPAALLRYMEAEEGVGTQALESAQYPAALYRLLEKLEDDAMVEGSVSPSSERGLATGTTGSASMGVGAVLPTMASIPASLRTYLEALDVGEDALMEAAKPLLAYYPDALYRLMEELDDEAMVLDASVEEVGTVTESRSNVVKDAVREKASGVDSILAKLDSIAQKFSRKFFEDNK